MILTQIKQYSLQGRLLSGDHNGELQIVLRILLTSIKGKLPFILT